ncbi:MAG: hypothetical protein ACTSX9_06795 [Candidatus Njordarchaeales archaeon]
MKNQVKAQSFVRYWNLHLPFAFRIAVEKVAKKFNIDEQDLRRKLLGDDLDIYFHSLKEIASFFNVNRDKQSWILLDESKPSNKFLLLGKWLITLQVIFSDALRKNEFHGEDPFKVFFKKKARKFLNALIDEINYKVGREEEEVLKSFPLQ